MKRRRLLVVVGGALGVCAVVLGHGVHRMQARRNIAELLPTFVEPGPGPRAPTARALGFAVGRSTLADVQKQLAGAGLHCPDTSLSARSEDPDTVSGASRVNHRSPQEANPQVRLTCNDVASTRLVDAERPPSRGRLLLVFDSPRHPLRHVSFERTFSSAEVGAAIADLDGTRARLADSFGPAGAGVPVPEPTRDLPWQSPRETAWRFADLQAKVSAINHGPRGVVVNEVVEVPWPVRADAPAGKASEVARR